MRTKQTIVVFSSVTQYGGEAHPQIVDLVTNGYRVCTYQSRFFPPSKDCPKPVYLNSVTLERDVAR